jgi:hypothetical protein
VTHSRTLGENHNRSNLNRPSPLNLTTPVLFILNRYPPVGSCHVASPVRRPVKP